MVVGELPSVGNISCVYFDFFRIASAMARIAASSRCFCSSGESFGSGRLTLYPWLFFGSASAFTSGPGRAPRREMNSSGWQ